MGCESEVAGQQRCPEGLESLFGRPLPGEMIPWKVKEDG